MNLEKDKVIGIVGGMGPQAGLALFNHILCHTHAATDQQHLSVMLMSFPQHIQDRTSFMEGKVSISPAYNVVRVIEKLIVGGAKVIGIACNTSYSPEIFNIIVEELDKLDSKVKLLNMPWEVCKYIKQSLTKAHRIGLMITNGTYKSKVYENLLIDLGYDVIIPEFIFQNDVIHKMIYDPAIGIKANPKGITREARLLLDKALVFFKDNKSDLVILGCTELSLILNNNSAQGMLLVDSTEILAKALIREATT